ncbi:MAG: hypothetical protein JWP08_3619 [Bryobacterales bacterium]|nr:hypothetical protein [Bryobacterales bacterium]
MLLASAELMPGRLFAGSLNCTLTKVDRDFAARRYGAAAALDPLCGPVRNRQGSIKNWASLTISPVQQKKL